MGLSPFPILVLLSPNIHLRILFSNTLSLRSSLNVRDHADGNIRDEVIKICKRRVEYSKMRPKYCQALVHADVLLIASRFLSPFPFSP